MKKNRIWIRDAINKGEVNFYVGQKVVLYRRKSSGYPKFLDENKNYVVKYVCTENVTIEEEVNNKYVQPRRWKINKTFLIPKDKCRDILISEILKDLD
jgi:hypothetical protein